MCSSKVEVKLYKQSYGFPMGIILAAPWANLGFRYWLAVCFTLFQPRLPFLRYLDTLCAQCVQNLLKSSLWGRPTANLISQAAPDFGRNCCWGTTCPTHQSRQLSMAALPPPYTLHYCPPTKTCMWRQNKKTPSTCHLNLLPPSGTNFFAFQQYQQRAWGYICGPHTHAHRICHQTNFEKEIPVQP